MHIPKRLLVVDDEETLTFSLYQAFSKAPIACEVVTASSGDAAWQFFQQKSFDVVITDLAMPGLSGLDLLRKIKTVNFRTQVIIITAYGSEDKREASKKLGAADFVEKPFDIFDLRNKVMEMLK